MRSYRNTPHSSTGVAPADMINNSSKLVKWDEPDQKLLELTKVAKNKTIQETKRMKIYADQRRKVTSSCLKVNDLVMYNQIKSKRLHNKFANVYESVQYRVKSVKNTMITVVDPSGKEMTRNVMFFKRGKPAINKPNEEHEQETTNNGEVVQLPEDNENTVETTPPKEASQPQRKATRISTRTKIPIIRLGIQQ
jgi:hypothetical protein